MIEMIVDSVRISVVGYQRVVVLKEKAADRYLLIWVGSSEAGSIAMALQGMTPPRPLSHDLMISFLERFGARVTGILVSKLVEDTFYALISVEAGGETFALDARPSDAIALALRAEAPIFADQEVLEKAGIVPETGEDGKPDDDRLSIFRDFVNTLDLTGLGEDDFRPCLKIGCHRTTSRPKRPFSAPCSWTRPASCRSPTFCAWATFTARRTTGSTRPTSRCTIATT